MTDALNFSEEEWKQLVQRYADEWRAKCEQEDRWIDRFKNLSEDKRVSIIKSLIEKYLSDSYRDRCYKRGYEVDTPLFWLYYEYAAMYGTDVYAKYAESKPDYLYFTTELYETPEGFIVERVDGQGSFINVMEKQEFEENVRSFKFKNRDSR